MIASRLLGFLGAGLLALIIGTTDAHAQMFVPTGSGTLRGLPGVEVIVETLQPELEKGGLSGASIRADVEARLRAGGVTVYASQVANPSPAKAYVYISLTALALPEGWGYAIAVQMHLRQSLRSPVTDSNIVNAMTWDMGDVLGVPASELPRVRSEIQSLVDRFVEDWTRVH